MKLRISLPTRTDSIRSFCGRLLLSGLLLGAVGCHSLGHRSDPECVTADCDPSSQGPSRLGSLYSFCDETCQRPDDCGYASIAAPPGTYVNGWNDAMICSARRYDFVINRHEWFSGGQQLGPEGRQHVAKIGEVLPTRPERVIIEAEPTEIQSRETYEEALARTAQLNEQRRLLIVNNLTAQGVKDAERRVMIAPLDRVGVRGAESPNVYNGLFIRRGGRGGGQRGGGGIGGGQGGGGGGGFGGAGGGFF